MLPLFVYVLFIVEARAYFLPSGTERRLTYGHRTGRYAAENAILVTADIWRPKVTYINCVCQLNAHKIKVNVNDLFVCCLAQLRAISSAPILIGLVFFWVN